MSEQELVLLRCKVQALEDRVRYLENVVGDDGK